MSPADLVREFEDLTLPEASFDHEAHVRLAWSYLELGSCAEAVPRFSRALRRFATHHGGAGKYHETITWAYLFVINERRERLGPGHDWTAFAIANPDLLTHRPSVLDRYYRPETLGSPLARRVFVLPDREGSAPELTP